MTLGYGITGIGYNPLGTMGLGMTGQYASFDAYMPSMMGNSYATAMTNPMFATGAASGMYGMGMGMYNPTYWAGAQQQIEASQVQHAGNMQKLILNNEVNGLYNSNSTLINKMLSDGDIEQGIRRLYEKVREGDQDGICEEFDKLKNYIYTTYKDELAARDGKINPATSATKIIEAIYTQTATALAGDGKAHSLEGDIRLYGEGYFENGFMSGLKSGHNKRTTDETLNHVFDYAINDQGSKEANRTLANGLGRVTSVLQKGAIGAGTGVAATGLTLGFVKLLTPLVSKLPWCGNAANFSWLKCMKSSWKPALLIGAIAGIVGDICWQISRDKD